MFQTGIVIESGRTFYDRRKESGLIVWSLLMIYLVTCYLLPGDLLPGDLLLGDLLPGYLVTCCLVTCCLVTCCLVTCVGWLHCCAIFCLSCRLDDTSLGSRYVRVGLLLTMHAHSVSLSSVSMLSIN